MMCSSMPIECIILSEDTSGLATNGTLFHKFIEIVAAYAKITAKPIGF